MTNQATSKNSLPQRELELINKHDIALVTLDDLEYPALLKHIHSPPPLLYCQGNVALLSKRSVAFVGSRKADVYGQQVVDHLIPEVVREGFVVVSGGAYGIDAMAHRATIKAGGRTIAVLGSGLLKPYPTANIKLFQEIVHSGGLVISSFPLLYSPLPENFPIRNRIIAGLSLATVVVQAAGKSGALLTARNALDEGRDVGAVPGSLFNEISAGCHELLAQGAQLITKPQDIFTMLGYQPVNSRACPSSFDKLRMSGHKECVKDPILAACSSPQSTDALMVATGLDYQALQERLWQLQIEGKLDQNMLGQWKSL